MSKNLINFQFSLIICMIMGACYQPADLREEKRGIVLVPNDIIDVGVDNWIRILKNNNLNLLGFHTNLDNLGTLQDLKELLESEAGKKLLAECKKNEIDIEYELHLLTDLLPRELFHKHPEYFPMDKEGNRHKLKNMCFTSEGAYLEIEKSLNELCQWVKPTTHRYYFWTDDVEDSFCHCNNCNEFSPSEQSLLYENRLLTILRKTDPLARVAHLAYHSTLAPPVKVKPSEGIFLEFAPIKRDYNKPMSKNYSDYLRQNLKVFSVDEAHILEYWIDASMFSEWNREKVVEIPWDIKNTTRDIMFYKSLGIRSITSFCIWVNNDYYGKYGHDKTMNMFAEYGEALSLKVGAHGSNEKQYHQD